MIDSLLGPDWQLISYTDGGARFSRIGQPVGQREVLHLSPAATAIMMELKALGLVIGWWICPELAQLVLRLVISGHEWQVDLLSHSVLASHTLRGEVEKIFPHLPEERHLCASLYAAQECGHLIDRLRNGRYTSSHS